jgi:hypothetical protein
MGMRGPKPSKVTALSEFWQELEMIVAPSSTNDFDRELMLHFITPKNSKNPSEFFSEKNSRLVQKYHAGNVPDKSILSDIYVCRDEKKFSEWIVHEAPDVTMLLPLAFKYDQRQAATPENCGQTLASAFSRIILNMLLDPATSVPICLLPGMMVGEGQDSAGYKKEFGRILLHECDMNCEVKGEDLIIDGGATSFCIMRIDDDPAKDHEVGNFVPVCPSCYERLSKMDKTSRIAILSESKQLWANTAELRMIATDAKLDEKIDDLLDAVAAYGIPAPEEISKDLEEHFDPVKIEGKLRDEPRFCGLVKFLASTDFETIRLCLKKASMEPGRAHFAKGIRSQIQAAYCALADAPHHSKEELFMSMSNAIQKRTHKSWILCAAFLAYYVQDCEFFDAITK